MLSNREVDISHMSRNGLDLRPMMKQKQTEYAKLREIDTNGIEWISADEVAPLRKPVFKQLSSNLDGVSKIKQRIRLKHRGPQ